MVLTKSEKISPYLLILRVMYSIYMKRLLMLFLILSMPIPSSAVEIGVSVGEEYTFEVVKWDDPYESGSLNSRRINKTNYVIIPPGENYSIRIMGDPLLTLPSGDQPSKAYIPLLFRINGTEFQQNDFVGLGNLITTTDWNAQINTLTEEIPDMESEKSTYSINAGIVDGEFILQESWADKDEPIGTGSRYPSYRRELRYNATTGVLNYFRTDGSLVADYGSYSFDHLVQKAGYVYENRTVSALVTFRGPLSSLVEFSVIFTPLLIILVVLRKKYL